MRAFTNLFDELDSTTSTLDKVVALKKYFSHQDASNSMWAVLLLTGRLSKRVLTGRDLRDLFQIATGFKDWMLEECHAHVGDTAETLSLLAQSLGLTRSKEEPAHDYSLNDLMTNKIPMLGEMEDQAEQAQVLLSWWKGLDQMEVFVLNKLITGAFRVGVSEKLVIRALAEQFEIPSDQVAHRISGIKTAGAEVFAQLISKDVSMPASSQPYPFCLAHSWKERKDQDWNSDDWCIEWKYDGIRAQVISREGKIHIWSRGEEEITESFKDLVELFASLPQGTVLDGEIVVIKDGQVGTFNDLQARLGRKKVSLKIMQSHPVGFIAYDCLEFGAQDLRSQSLRERKQKLKSAVEWLPDSPQLKVSEILEADSIDALEKLRSLAREKNAEGVMIKSWKSPYAVGRKTGNWWKFKVDPLTLDAVLIYAQAGSGRRANLYTDYTFALWSDDKQLVPFAKAYSGLDQSEIDKLDRWIRAHTKEKFGPVRAVDAEQVFEIGFEGIARSQRHKSGIAVRFPRILRWRTDKPANEADTLSTAMELL